jgi:hypothetical protein
MLADSMARSPAIDKSQKTVRQFTRGCGPAKHHSTHRCLPVRSISVLGETIYIHPLLARAPRVDCSEGKQVYFVRGMDTSNITIDAEQFETIEEALQRACAIEKTGALVELFQDDNPAPVMDFAEVSAWCRSNSERGD